MGLFDFLKKKKEQKKPQPRQAKANSIQVPVQDTWNFAFIQTYAPHLVQFIHMQSNNNYSPIAAYEKNDGEVVGYLFIGEDKTYDLSIPEVIELMEKEFEKRLNTGTIKSYAIYYHSSFDGKDKHNIAEYENDFKAISMRHFYKSKRGTLALPYTFEKTTISYGIITGFSPPENNYIYSIELEEGKNYFQDRISMSAPLHENEIGLKMKVSNTMNLENLWCGIFGFEYYRNEGGANLLNLYLTNLLSMEPVENASQLDLHLEHFAPITFKAFTQDDKLKTFLPQVETQKSLPIENKEIDEWENVDKLHAIITGRGRDTFAVKYFATDYIENSEQYQSKLKLDIKMTGVVYVLDIYKEEAPKEGSPAYSPEFCAYMPNSEMAHYACFDFIGELKSFQEVKHETIGELKGYMMTVKLINHPDGEDFFTIDLFVNHKNMRFGALTNGMKLTGMLQLHGQIA